MSARHTARFFATEKPLKKQYGIMTPYANLAKDVGPFSGNVRLWFLVVPVMRHSMILI